MSLIHKIQAQLEKLDKRKMRRRRRFLNACTDVLNNATCHSHQSHLQKKIHFSSNDYLGFANHPELIDALAEGAKCYGVGSGGSHLLSGHSIAHQKLEEKLAQFSGDFIKRANAEPRALFFSSGYMANIGVITALARNGATIFSDELNHASLIDGAKLSSALVIPYPHKNTIALNELLSMSKAKIKMIVTDSVFSMDGDIAPLPELLKLANQYDCWLIVDDAHGFGVLGNKGAGVLAQYSLLSTRIIYMGTLGKAAGVSGAFVVAHKTVIEWLIQRARTYIFTTALSPAIAYTLLKSIELIESEEGEKRRTRLQKHITRVRKMLHREWENPKWHTTDSLTAIQTLIIGENEPTLNCAKKLEENGIWVPAIRPPSVGLGKSRLRISLSAIHSEEDIDRLCSSLKDFTKFK